MELSVVYFYKTIPTAGIVGIEHFRVLCLSSHPEAPAPHLGSDTTRPQYENERKNGDDRLKLVWLE